MTSFKDIYRRDKPKVSFPIWLKHMQTMFDTTDLIRNGTGAYDYTAKTIEKLIIEQKQTIPIATPTLQDVEAKRLVYTYYKLYHISFTDFCLWVSKDPTATEAVHIYTRYKYHSDYRPILTVLDEDQPKTLDNMVLFTPKG